MGAAACLPYAALLGDAVSFHLPRGRVVIPGLALRLVSEWALEPHSLWLGVPGLDCSTSALDCSTSALDCSTSARSTQANTSRGIQGAAKQAAPMEGAARQSMYQPGGWPTQFCLLLVRGRAPPVPAARPSSAARWSSTTPSRGHDHPL